MLLPILPPPPTPHSPSRSLRPRPLRRALALAFAGLALILPVASSASLAAESATTPAAIKAPTSAPLRADLRARGPVNLLPADLAASATFRNDSESTPPPTFTWSRPSGASSPILRVESFNRPKAYDHVSARWKFARDVKRGDVMLARFFVRAEYARQESGEALFELSVHQHAPGFARHVILALTAGPEWALYEIPFVASRDATTEQGVVQLAFGSIPQAVQLAGLEVWNFGSGLKLADLPSTRFTYRGREAGAAWREAALERIQKIRTAPIRVRVVDAMARPVPGAEVEARLVRPEFLWGTSVAADTILAEGADAEKYRRTLLENFDTAVIENNMKWPKWSGSVASRERALRALDWLEDQGLRLRGHTLVWPGDGFSPGRVQRLPAPREALPLLIQEHIRDIMTVTRGRIASWDVINEMMNERDYFKTMPETEAAEWFKVARATDPEAKLIINDYGMLNSARSPDRIRTYLAQIKRLRDAGAPIDGLGVQGHIGRQMRNPEDVLADLDLLATSGLEINITEFDINTPDEELQADYTRDFLIALYSHESVVGFIKWGFWQRRHWKPDAAMFRPDWTPKPNHKSWHDLVRGAWLTRAKGATDSDGRFETRGHLGEYEFNVKAGDKTSRHSRILSRDGAVVTIQLP